VTSIQTRLRAWSRACPSKDSQKSITGILTLRMRLTIILLVRGLRKVRGVKQDLGGGIVKHDPSLASGPRAEGQRVAAEDCVGCTGCASRAARLLRRLLEIVRSMMAPQLMHCHA
jgi:hypothetical protein